MSAQDAFISGLLGVLIGAGISTFVSLMIHKDQYRAELLISKREEIYKPLYEHIQLLLSDLDVNPYPIIITTNKLPDREGRTDLISFYKWSEILSDARIIVIPKWIANAFSDLENVIVQYNYLYSNCSQIVERIMIEELRKRNIISNANGILVMDYILAGKELEDPTRSLFTFIEFVDADIARRYNENAKDIVIEIFDICSKVDEVKEIRKLYEDWLLYDINWINKELTKIIYFN